MIQNYSQAGYRPTFMQIYDLITKKLKNLKYVYFYYGIRATERTKSI